ncbi:hypothetical protein JIG36_45150 [Actinoplanes sp. LDG1-06]|uniref:ABC transporter permease n=1 Tax=Paractinoplanes ovalisporus TaxID=2810368 RepID=A0ABS2ASB8_9ACTN|nr:hypothetical protein [Actinoplanes ovalisporus]MBM2622711.1 hypothetical protein [Actinoplanes ovalisporus]
MKLLRSKGFWVGAVAVALLVVVALTASGRDYVSYHPELIDPMRGAPLGDYGGAGADYWFGVEPLTGRDLFARLGLSLQYSLGLAVVAAAVEVLVGLLIAVAARRGRWRGLGAPALMYFALLVPLNLIVEVALSYTGMRLRTPPEPAWGEMLADAALWFRHDPAYLLFPGLLLVVTVFAFLLVADAVRRKLVR